MRRERRYPRFLKEREGKTFLRVGCRHFTTVDVSRKGVCIRFNDNEYIPPLGTILELEIPTFKDLKPLHIRGTLKWIKKKSSNLVAGVELKELLCEYEWIKLRDHFNLAPLQASEIYSNLSDNN